MTATREKVFGALALQQVWRKAAIAHRCPVPIGFGRRHQKGNDPNLKARIIFQFRRIASPHADLSSPTAQIPSLPPQFVYQLD